MSNHPVNLGIRFALEIGGLLALGVWSWWAVEGPFRYALVLIIPGTAAAIWGVFRVPGDPGPAPVATPGPVRLAIEITFFVLATWGLAASGYTSGAWILGGITALHYLASFDRVARMLRNLPPPG
jgi:hypothetical protein